ncbi:MAG: hypothetical protein ABEH81_08360 [Halopenitus sp.]
MKTSSPERTFSSRKLRSEHQAYWFGRYNVNAMLLMSGLGERLKPPKKARKQLGSLANFDPEKMPANPYLLKAVYAAGDPHFQQAADFSDLSTLYWDRESMDETLEPEAQALTIQKVTAKGLRTRYHRRGKDRFIALVQLKEAMALATTLRERLTTSNGLVATRTPAGDLADPQPVQQATALAAYSSLALSLTDPDLLLYQKLPNSREFSARVRTWADELFAAARTVRPESSKALALTIRANGWYAVATKDADRRRDALGELDALAQQIHQRQRSEDLPLTELAWAVYGLAEASHVTNSTKYATAARRIFFERMEARWQPDAGIYTETASGAGQVYTPATAAAVFAAINAVRFVATPGLGTVGNPRQADKRYVQFFRNAVVESGLQQAHAIPLAVHPAYQKEEPKRHFTAESVPLSAEGHGPHGLCPVYAAEVSYEDDEWTVTNRRFRTAAAMHLSLLSPTLSATAPDGFIPIDRLRSELASGSQ